MVQANIVFKNISAISVVVLVCTFVRLYVYYIKYNVNIVSYIDISEIPKYSIDLFIFAFIVFWGLFNVPTYTEHNKTKPVDITAKVKFMKRFTYFVSFVTVFLTYKLYTSLTEYIKNWDMYHILVGINTILIITAILFSIWLVQNEKPKKKDINGFMKTLVLCNLIALSINLGCLQGYEWTPREHVVFVYNNKTIVKSTSSYYNIGQTSRYYFMYNEVSKITQIFTQDKITYLSIIKAKPSNKEKTFPSRKTH